ncbi:MAG: Ig-like domain-containing protein [Elusimicrobia bacterium]|nr:Ig-like domain-containing protein [Elusimicrobiota bacterium]
MTRKMTQHQLGQIKGYSTKLVLGCLLTLLLVNFTFASQITVNFDQDDYNNYFDQNNFSNLYWNIDSEKLYLSTGTIQEVLGMYPAASIEAVSANDQAGWTFFVEEDCFIEGFSRYAPISGNTAVRLWTDDPEENYRYSSQPKAFPWNGEVVCEDVQGWSPIAKTPFLEKHYPLTKGNTYWIALVNSEGTTQMGRKYAPSSGSSFVKLSPPYWYLKNKELLLPDTLEEIGLNLQGIADIKLNQFVSSGTMTTGVMDLKATKVEIEDFNASFLTSNSQMAFDRIIDNETNFTIVYDKINALNRAPFCNAYFKISQSSTPTGPFSDFTDNLALIDKRYIKVKIDFTTTHRGVSPFLDSFSIQYNAYPEKIESSSIWPEDGMIITTATPVFKWNAAYDLDGDTITYTFYLSKDPDFLTLEFSTTTISFGTTTVVEVPCPKTLDHRTTYYFKIDMEDSKGASVPFDEAIRFETELIILSLTNSSVSSGARILATDVQTNGIDFSFTKDVDEATINSAVNFKDGFGQSVSFTYQYSGDAFRIIPQTGEILPCTQYIIEISTALKDTRGLNLQTPYSFNFLTLQDKDVSFSLNVGNKAQVYIPRGASPDDYYTQGAEISVETNALFKTANNVALASAFIIPISTVVYSIEVSDRDGNNITNLSGASLILPFFEDEVFIDTQTASQFTVNWEYFKIFRLDEVTQNWSLVEGEQSIDYNSKKITANLTQGGYYAVCAYPKDVSGAVNIRNIPNPFFPETNSGKGTEITYYLSRNATVNAKIFTPTGHLIYEQKYLPGQVGGSAATNTIYWDGKNNDGAYVASGIYILYLDIKYVDGSSEVRKRKIGFIR